MAMTQKDVIQRFMASLDKTNLSGVKAFDEAVKACSNFTSAQDLINQMISDCKKASSPSAFIRDYCGIILNNADTGAITGSDVGGSTSKNAEDIVPEKGAASYPSSTTFTKGGLTVTVPAKSSLTADQQMVVQGLYSWWIEESLKLIKDSYGYSFTDSDATVKTINLEFENKPNSTTLAYVSSNYKSIGNSGYKANELTLVVNMGRFNNLSASNVNGSSSGSSFYLDRTLAHELTHAIMAAKITNFAYLHDFLTEGMAELTHGIDDERKDLIEYFAENPSKLQSYLRLDVNTTGDAGEYAAGYMLLRYLAKQSEGLEAPADTTSGGGTDTGSGGSNETLSGGSSSITNWSNNNTVLTGTSGNDTISNYGSYVTINAGAGNDSIYNSSSATNITIEGSEGKDSIEKFGNYVMIKGGADNDSIFSHGSNTTIEGGAGNDTIYSYYSKGNSNSIIDGGAGDDKITHSQGDYATINAGAGDDSILSSGDNVTINAGAGNDKITNYGANVTIDAGEGNNYISSSASNVTIKAGAGNDSISNGTTGRNSIIEGGAGDDSIDNNGSNVQIYAGAGDDSIYNSKSYVTINAGEGNDSIRNYGQNVLVQYSAGDGNDTISGLNSDDTLQITGASYYTTKSGYSDMIIGVGNDSILVQGGASSSVNIQGTFIGGSKNINNQDYNTLLAGSAYNDSILNTGSNVTIDALAGNDTIQNRGSNVQIYAGAGNDSIDSWTNYVTVDAGAGNDSIWNSGYYVSINAGEDDDYIYDSYCYNSTINAGTGNDTVSLAGSGYSYSTLNAKIYAGDGADFIYTSSNKNYITIDAGAGNDTIQNYGSYVTITPGAGNDTVYIANSSGYGKNILYKYSAGDGNDTITGLDSNDTLQISGSSYTTTTSGYDLVFNVGNSSILVNGGTYTNFTVDGIFGGSSLGSNDINNFSSNTVLTGTSGKDTIRNYAQNVTINADNGDDSIHNEGYNSSINAGNGNDTVYNEGSYVTIDAGAGSNSVKNYYGESIQIYSGNGADSIYNEGGNNLTINAGVGNNYISNSVGSNVQISTGADNDSISNEKGSNYVTIDAGAGRDYISNYGASVKIYAGDGNDYIYNAEENNDVNNVSIDAGAGNDSVTNYGASVKIYSASGDNYIANYGGSSVQIYVGAGNDYIYNSNLNSGYYGRNDSNITIDAGAGNNYIYNNFSYVTINAGAGKDSIDNSGDEVIISTGAGDDSISISGSNVTLNAGKGNDSIYINDTSSSTNILYQYKTGDGNDTLFGLDANDTLQIAASSYSTRKSGASNLIIDIGNGNDLIFVQDGVDIPFTIETVEGGEDTTSGGAGVSVENYQWNTLIGGASGDDNITNYGSNVTIDAGAGADSIYNLGSNVNINGGAGDDFISLSNYSYNNVIEFSNVSGNDTVYGLKENDTLQIIGAEYSTIKSGTDLIIGVGDNSILAKNAANSNFKISGNYGGGSGTDTGSGGGNDTTPADALPIGISIKNSVVTAAKTFTGKEINLADYEDATKVNAAAVTQAVSIIGTAANNSLKGGKGADTIYGGAGNDTVSLGGGKDIYIYSGGNDYIQDYKAGEDKIKLSSGSITSASLSSSNVILKTSNGNITVKNGKGKNITVIDSSGNETTNIYPLSTLPAGISIKNSVVTAAKTFVGNKIDLADYEGATTVNAAAVTQAVSIVGTAAANSLKGGAGADTIYGGAGNDTVSLGGGNDVYIYSGGNDYIQDYKAGEDKIKLASGSITSASLSSSNVILKTSNGNITVKGGKDKAITIIDSSGNETTNIYPTETLPAGISIKNSVVTAAKTFTGKEINLSNYAATTVNAAAVTQGVSIVGTAANNSLKGGKGADTIIGGAGNDTVSLGGGNDVYIYSGDYIQDYKAGEDKIKLASGSITSASLSSSNVILKTSNGNITVKNGKGKNITVIDSSGKETTNIYPTETLPAGISISNSVLTASSSFSGKTIDLADYAKVTKVDAAALSKAVSIVGSSANNSLTGGKGADTIYGGAGNDSIFGNNGADKLYGDAGNDYIEGGAGNDTLYGGAGNDTLTGGNGKDTFVYSGGKDVITDYTAAQDKIQVDGTISNTSYKGDDVIFKIGSGTLTVKDAKGKKISVTDSSGTQTYSRTLDILYDNNFMTDDTSLDSITEQKFSVTEIQNYNNETLAQDDNILTFADKK